MDATHQLLKCAEITMNLPGQNRENDENGGTKNKMADVLFTLAIWIHLRCSRVL